jgi:hypothetical protein
LVFPYPAVPAVGNEKPTSVGGFCPFIPGGQTISFDTALYLSKEMVIEIVLLLFIFLTRHF